MPVEADVAPVTALDVEASTAMSGSLVIEKVAVPLAIVAPGTGLHELVEGL